MSRLDIFISYSRAHSALVTPLVKLLKLDNRRVFQDEITIAPGDKWEDVILDSVRWARIVVVIWCSHAKRSRWMMQEWTLALSLKKRVIPVLLGQNASP